MTDDEITNHLFEGLVRHEMSALESPHVVVCRDPRTGVTAHHGPYPDALVALAAAAELETTTRAGGENATVVCRVARLWEPAHQPAPRVTRPSDGSEG